MTTKKLTLSALFLALALILPFFTGQIQGIGQMLLPMHIPVLICAYFCDKKSAALVGFAAPLLRFFLFKMPPIYPTGIAMSFELLTYGLIAGLLYEKLAKNKVNIYVSLIGAMIAGRIVWGAVTALILGIAGSEFTFAIFISSAITSAIPGIILQIVAIPVLVMLLKKNKSLA